MTLIHHPRWRVLTIGILLLTLLTGLGFSTFRHTFAATTLAQLSSDPYTNSRNEHQTEVSPASFSFGSTIVAAFQVGHGNHNGGSTNIGWATSSNGGHSWTNGFLPHTTKTVKGMYDRVENPSVAYDAAHNTWMITASAFISNNSIAILVSLSTNGGTTWSDPIAIIQNSSEDLDKNWITCDTTSTSPFYGHCYVEWHDERQANLVQLSTSTNGGLTWGTPISTLGNYAGFNGHPLVQPNGTVIVPINKPTPFPKSKNTIMAFTSTDGGTSWGSTVTVASVQAHTLGGSLRSLHIFSAGIDGSGKVYVVWEDCRFESGCTANDLVMTTSTDGVHWSAVTRIPIDPVGSGVDHFIPGFAVDPTTSGSTAHLALAYYYLPVANCDTTTCQLDVGYVSSSNGGNTWTTPTHLAGPMNVTWLTSTVWGYMTGDYITASYANGLAFPIFPYATAPSGTTLHQAINTTSAGL
ncbi:MAG TPA: sialidase family protein [Ktedonobacteraceae bacterium]|nr:sialidase family protein [Ktedonobacteraceae bacterium]